MRFSKAAALSLLFAHTEIPCRVLQELFLSRPKSIAKHS